jgi:hypothetical protein
MQIKINEALISIITIHYCRNIVVRKKGDFLQKIARTSSV